MSSAPSPSFSSRNGTANGAVMSAFAERITSNKYAHDKAGGGKESWAEIARRQGMAVVKPYLPEYEERATRYIEDRKFVPGGRYLYAAGRKFPQVNNCFLFMAEDSREGWSKLLGDATSSLMTGGGIGGVYSKIRGEGSVVGGMGGKSTGPLALMRMVNECGRYVVQGGSRRAAIWAGLHWNHPDVFKFIKLKDWSEGIQKCRREDYHFPAPMDGTNISVILDDDFFEAYQNENQRDHDTAADVYWEVIRNMLRTGEPGFSVDVGENAGEHLRNACTEVTSRDNGDMCNLGSVNMARISTLEEFVAVIETGIAFLMCGTIYSKLPLDFMYDVRTKNRRIGLGLMGVHEWLLRRGYKYGRCDELEVWMREYANLTGAFAYRFADRLGISRPVATRSIAPTGTISIVAETTSGIEPIFATAYKRRYLDGTSWRMQYVIDATAKRLIEGAGVDPALVEDAYTLAEDVERRISFQAWMQQFVDHGISSTINLPPWGSSINNGDGVTAFGKKLMKYLPLIRGITAYPDGARGGQPLNRVSYFQAVENEGVEYTENGADIDENLGCKDGFCNS
jgi:ribonucleoside-diphosphate reductase alpha chain